MGLARCWWDLYTRPTAADSSAMAAEMDAADEALAAPGVFTTVATYLDNIEARPEIIPHLEADEPGSVRSAALIYLEVLPRQADPALLRAINAGSCAIERATLDHRVRLGGRELAPHEVRGAFRSRLRGDPRREEVWRSSLAIGAAIGADFVELVKLRNRAARQVGSPDYHALQLHRQELDRDWLLSLFDDLDGLTRGPYREAKATIDARLASAHGIATGDLRPWHYHDTFFRRAPQVYGVDLDASYLGVDVAKLCGDFYAGIGLPVDDVLGRSDLYERPGKGPRAFCIDLDRAGDVRVLANVVADEDSAGLLLHELGHAAYFKNVDKGLPCLLRSHAHSLAGEGTSMLFERFSRDGDWLGAMGVRVGDPDAFAASARRMRRDGLLIFARWSQVVCRFEMAMYADPDRDLDALWWDLVEEYQEIRRPEGRLEAPWGGEDHIVNSPCDYHNYMLGDLFAAQLHRAICDEALEGVDTAAACYAGRPEVGRFLADRVFSAGKSLRWDALTRHATGADLGLDAFAAEILHPSLFR